MVNLIYTRKYISLFNLHNISILIFDKFWAHIAQNSFRDKPMVRMNLFFNEKFFFSLSWLFISMGMNLIIRIQDDNCSWIYLHAHHCNYQHQHDQYHHEIFINFIFILMKPLKVNIFDCNNLSDCSYHYFFQLIPSWMFHFLTFTEFCWLLMK